MSATDTPKELPGTVAPGTAGPARTSHEQPSLQRPAASRPAPQIERSDLRRRLLTVVVLAFCVGAVVLAVPDLRPVVREMSRSTRRW